MLRNETKKIFSVVVNRNGRLVSFADAGIAPGAGSSGGVGSGLAKLLASGYRTFCLEGLVSYLGGDSSGSSLEYHFGLASAWLLTKYEFPGKAWLGSLIDLPFAISPVVAGLFFIMLLGRMSPLYPLLQAEHIAIVFAVPGIILATVFVTFPFITRELVPVLESQGNSQEEAAATMGAGGWTIFRHITLPRIKWALLYGIILCSARAMGEFGAVSVVSGHIRGKTNTLPLHIEILYNEYNFTAAFAVAAILVILAVIVLILRNLVEWRGKRRMKDV